MPCFDGQTKARMQQLQVGDAAAGLLAAQDRRFDTAGVEPPRRGAVTGRSDDVEQKIASLGYIYTPND